MSLFMLRLCDDMLRLCDAITRMEARMLHLQNRQRSKKLTSGAAPEDLASARFEIGGQS